jgi:hypothetical protein
VARAVADHWRPASIAGILRHEPDRSLTVRRTPAEEICPVSRGLGRHRRQYSDGRTADLPFRLDAQHDYRQVMVLGLELDRAARLGPPQLGFCSARTAAPSCCTGFRRKRADRDRVEPAARIGHHPCQRGGLRAHPRQLPALPASKDTATIRHRQRACPFGSLPRPGGGDPDAPEWKPGRLTRNAAPPLLDHLFGATLARSPPDVGSAPHLGSPPHDNLAAPAGYYEHALD